MYGDERILAIIPARGGSKGIPRKNIKELCGKPLINYTVEAGNNSKYIDYLMVSTDDEEIANVAKNSGAEIPFFRPDELASDTSKTIDAVIDAIAGLEKKGKYFDVLVLLQPTGPLRDARDIDNAIDIFFDNGKKSLVSVSEADDNPILMRTIENNKLRRLYNVSSTVRRQDMPKYYKVNGCIYINKIVTLSDNTSFNDNEVPFIMEKSH